MRRSLQAGANVKKVLLSNGYSDKPKGAILVVFDSMRSNLSFRTWFILRQRRMACWLKELVLTSSIKKASSILMVNVWLRESAN